MKCCKLKSGEELLVREAVPEDARALLDYMNRIGGESDNLLYGKNEIKRTAAQEQEFLYGMQKDPNGAMFVGLLRGQIIGSAQCGRKSPQTRTWHRGSVALAVSKAQWGKGVGRCLMQRLMDYAKEIGLEMLELEVRADNAGAIALYQKTGFVEIGRYKNFFKYAPGVYADALLMQCVLS